jgi:hypothetical protein
VIYMLEVWCSFRTANRREQVYTTIQDRITAYPAGSLSDAIPPVCTRVDAVYKGWTNAIHVQLGYLDGVLRDGEWDAIVAALGTGQQGPVTKSLAYRWDHDEVELTDANYQRIDF